MRRCRWACRAINLAGTKELIYIVRDTSRLAPSATPDQIESIFWLVCSVMLDLESADGSDLNC